MDLGDWTDEAPGRRYYSALFPLLPEEARGCASFAGDMLDDRARGTARPSDDLQGWLAHVAEEVRTGIACGHSL